MDAQYWAGIATGLGWGAALGLAVALGVALFVKRIAFPNTEPHGVASSNVVPTRYVGER